MFFPIDFQWGFFASFFANYVATVTRFGKKSNSRSFPAEPHVLMYILPGFCQPCGRNNAALFCGKIDTLLSMAEST